MKVSGDWLTCATTQTVCAMLETAGHQALLVGGCVRNALLGAPVTDIDIATDALPLTVMQRAKQAGLKALPTGIDHGTITVIADGVPHEITTFRKDVATDGRRAVVAFSNTVEDDARRRDFTMNALYVTSDGTLVDPLGGLADLKARRFVFIDDAAQRIREDYLRILRYFRFHAWYGDVDAGLDPEALAAIAENSAGIETLSKERVGSEMIKLLSAKDPAPAVAAMRQSGALACVLDGADDKALAPLVHFEQQSDEPPEPIRRLAALGGQGAEAALRLGKKQAKRLADLHDAAGDITRASVLAYRFDADFAVSALMLRAALLEMPYDPAIRAEAMRGGAQVFPIKAADLMDRAQGPALGALLRSLEDRWIASDFTLDRAALLHK